jgi:hypothetical protein
MKVSDLKASIYADDIMIWGDNVKEFKIRLSHWERESKNYGLQINLKKKAMLRLSRKEERNTIMKICRSKMKQVDRFTYLGSMAEKKGYIQNEINESIRKASKFCHLINSILWNKDINRKCKNTIHKVYFKKILLYEVQIWTCNTREESKTQATKMKFLRAIIGNTKKKKSGMQTSEKRS